MAGPRQCTLADVKKALCDEVLQAVRHNHMRGQELVAVQGVHHLAVLPRVHEDPCANEEPPIAALCLQGLPASLQWPSMREGLAKSRWGPPELQLESGVRDTLDRISAVGVDVREPANRTGLLCLGFEARNFPSAYLPTTLK